jgi:hypothetical protein
LKIGKPILSLLGGILALPIWFVGANAASNSVTVPYSGRIAVNNTNFTGTGQFKFAIVDNGTVTNPPTRRATATANLTGGFVTGYTVNDGGAGYTTNPPVTLTGGGGSGATATATVSNGQVVSITATAAGSGYSSTPTVVIANPPAAVPSTSYLSYWSQDGSSSNGSQPVGFVEIPVTKGLYSIDLGDPGVLGMNALPDSAIKAGAKLRVWFNDGTRGFQQLSPDVSLGMAAISRAVEAQANASDAKQSAIATSNNLATTTTSLTSQINTVNGNLSSATNQLGTQIGTVSNTLNTSLGSLANTTASNFTAVSNNLSQVSNSLAGAVFTNTNSLQRILHQNLAAIYGLPPLADSGHLVLYARDGVVTGVNSVLLTRDGTNFTPVRYPLRNLGIQTPKTWIQDREGNDLYFILSNGIAGGAHRDLTNLPYSQLAATREIIFDELITTNFAGAISSNGVPTIWRHQFGYVPPGGMPGGMGSVTNVPAGLSGVQQLVFNDYQALALLSNGTVTNWGDNNNLQPPSDLTNVRSLAIGDIQGNQYKAAAVLNDGNIRLFGSGASGMLTTSLPSNATNIRSARFFRDNVIAITGTNDGSKVIMWGSDNLQVPSNATNIESAHGFIFGDSTRFFVQARRFDGSLVIWGNTDSELTNIPSGLTKVTRTTLLGANFTAYTMPAGPGMQDSFLTSEVRRNPYIVAETSDGGVFIWGGRPGDEQLGYLTNATSFAEGVTKLQLHDFTNTGSASYPILAAQRVGNTPVVWARNGLSNVPSYATNLVRLVLTGGANSSSEGVSRYFVGESADNRVVVWGNGTNTNGSYLWENPLITNVHKFNLFRPDTDRPVAVALLEDKTMRVWGGSQSQTNISTNIPVNLTNIHSFHVHDLQFDTAGFQPPLIVANSEDGKVFSWFSDGQTYGAESNGFKEALASLTGVRILPYEQDVVSSREGKFLPATGATPATIDWPILFVPLGGSPSQVRVVSRQMSSAGAPYGFVTLPLTPDAFSLEDIESVFPIGSVRTTSDGAAAGGGSYGWTIAFKMKNGAFKFQAITDFTLAWGSIWNRTGAYFSSPNAVVRHVFTGRQLGLNSGASSGAAPGMSGSSVDNLVIVAEPAPISP